MCVIGRIPLWEDPTEMTDSSTYFYFLPPNHRVTGKIHIKIL